MMKKIKEYKLTILISIIFVIISIVLTIIYNKSIDGSREFENNYYYVSYDNSWTIKEESDNKLVLKHGYGELSFNIYNLDNDKVYLDIDSMIDSIRYEIEKNNPNYQLLSKEDSYITKYNNNGYWLLYENDNNNVKIGIYKDGEHLVIIKFEAKIKYFDMLLDSANNIIYNFNLLDKSYSLGSNLSIKFGDVILKDKDSTYTALNKTYNDEIANNNYLVNYDLPVNYQRVDYNSTYGYYIYQGFGNYTYSSELGIHIYLKNLYEYLKDDSFSSLYSKYSVYRSYKDFEESLSILDQKKEIYIYKNSYKTTNSFGDNSYENVVLIYALDRNHTLVIDFENKNIPITQELINSLKINEIKNYSSYIKGEYKDNKYITYLKKKKTSLGDGIAIKISIPKEYREIDLETNIYETRYFGNNYNSDLDIYDYRVRYAINLTEELAINEANSYIDLNSKRKYEVMKYKGTIKVNNLDMKLYEGYYTQNAGLFYSKEVVSKVKLLTYKLPNDKILSVKIEGNDKEIDMELIKNIVSFEIIEDK